MCRRFHSGWFGSFRHTKGVVGFIRVRCVNLGAPCGSPGSFGFVGLIQERPGDHHVHSGLLGRFRSALGVVGKSGLRWVRYGAPCRSSGSLSFNRIVWVHSGALRG